MSGACWNDGPRPQPPLEIKCREVWGHTEFPPEPCSFEFEGTREMLAAHLIAVDSQRWQCIDYVFYELNTQHWCVWRR